MLNVLCSHGRERLTGRDWTPSLKGNLLSLSAGYKSLMFVRLSSSP